LVLEAAALGMMVGGIAVWNAGWQDKEQQSNVGGYLEFAGLGTYVLAPPVVHWAHGNVGKGFGSLGLMLGAPLAGGLTGLALAATSDDPWAGLAGLIYGALAGGAIAVIVDSAALAYDYPEREDPTTARVQKPTFQLAPTIAFTQQRASVGVAGSF